MQEKLDIPSPAELLDNFTEGIAFPTGRQKPTSFFSGKKILITGHTGFKGTWLTLMLLKQGAIVKGFSHQYIAGSLFDIAGVKDLLGPANHIIGDISNADGSIGSVIEEFKPDYIFHMAAQPLVKESYYMPQDTFRTNVLGTVNLLEGLRLAEYPEDSEQGCVAVIVTTDKCYEILKGKEVYSENDSLGGLDRMSSPRDPYSASKACAELVSQAYSTSFFNHTGPKPKHIIGTVRGGNVIGPGDFSDNRLIPDAFRSLMADKPLKLHNPESTRPWQHVIECLYGYLAAARWMRKNNRGGTWNIGPKEPLNKTTLEIATKFQEEFKAEDNRILAYYQNLEPGDLANLANYDKKYEESLIGKDTSRYNLTTRDSQFYGIELIKNTIIHESKKLELDTTKASEELRIASVLSYDEMIKSTAIGYYHIARINNLYDSGVREGFTEDHRNRLIQNLLYQLIFQYSDKFVNSLIARINNATEEKNKKADRAE